MQKAIFTLLFIGLISNVLEAQELKKQRIAVFKNGKGFFVKTYTINAEKGLFTFEQLPDALFGTFWLSAEGNTLKGVKSYLKKTDTLADHQSVYQLFVSNKGKNVRLFLDKGEELEGKILLVQDNSTGKFLTLKTATNWLTVGLDLVRRFSFDQEPSLNSVQKKEKRVMEIELEKGRSDQNLDLMYMQNGISWLPSYKIDLVSDEKARISLQAALMNDAEDLDNATISMVVGVPNFSYDYLKSPLSLTSSINTFLGQLQGNTNSYNNPNSNLMNQSNNRREAYSNMITTQTIGGYSNESQAFGSDLGGTENTENSAETQTQEDLFFYIKEGVKLPKGGRALYTLFEAEVPCRHLYEVILTGGTGNGAYKTEESPNSVWHSIELENKTKNSWTTGSAMVVKQEGEDVKPLSQDLLRYTPSGAKVSVRMSIAPDILVKDSEIEVLRENSVKKEGGIRYDLATVEATIKVKNHKKKPIELEIRRNLTGLLGGSNMEWKVQQKLDFYTVFNQSNQICWNLKLAAEEEKTITYKYKVYIRRD